MAPPGVRTTDLVEARRLFADFRWRACVELLTEAEPLDGEALTLLGKAAQLIGADKRSAEAFARAYQGFLETGDVRSAARSAMSGALVLENAGDAVRSRAWAARAERLVADHELDGGEAAWVLSYRAHELMAEQRVAEALLVAQQGERVGLAARNTDAVVLCRLTIGFALLFGGQPAVAIDVFDEIMLAVSSDETSP